MKRRYVYVPFTSGGSMLAHLEARSEAQAWTNLLHDLQGLYVTRAEAEARGFTVEKFGRGADGFLCDAEPVKS